MVKTSTEESMRYPQFAKAIKNMGFDIGTDSEWIYASKDEYLGMTTVLGKVSRKEQYNVWITPSLSINEKQRRKLWFTLCQFAATHPNDRAHNVVLKTTINDIDIYIREYYRSTNSYVLTDKFVNADVFHTADAGKISTDIMNRTGISFELESLQ
nr:MAG TPA: hypothetical protein [Caudoviricetes sp.]